MPLSSKGEEILANMRKEYGSKKGESVFYASKNAGKISGVDRADKIRAIADCAVKLADDGRRLEERMDRVRKDASKEYHDLESSFAKKTAQKALEAGDHDVAKKWIDYGTKHAEESAKKAERMEGPPEDKKDSKKKI